MNSLRIRKYSDRIDIIEKRISQIKEWTEDLSPEDFEKNELIKLAVYKAYQEIIEASMDLVAMLCKDSGKMPKDDYANIETIASQGIIKREIAVVLAEGNGLRNRIIHRYVSVDDRKAFIEINESLDVFEDFVEMVERWIEKNLAK